MRKSLQKTSILIVRLGAMGDVLLASPVAFAIRKQNPNAHICWLVQTEYKDLLEGISSVDEVICWDRSVWQEQFRNRHFLRLFKSIRDLHQKLRKHKFDLALDLHGLLKSGLLTRLSGAKMRVGLGSREGSHMLMTRTISRNLVGQAQVGSEYRYLMNQLGFTEQNWSMYVPLHKQSINNLKAMLSEKIRNENYAVICPFSTRPQNQWLDDNWQQLALRIRGRYQLRTVILGSVEDKDKAESIARLCGAINLTGLTSYQESAAAIQGASLVVGVDNGLTHIGHALKIPTVSLFGSTCPYSHTGQESSTVIYLDKECSPCAKNPTCKGKFGCMRDISADLVLTEIKPLMKNFYEKIKG